MFDINAKRKLVAKNWLIVSINVFSQLMTVDPEKRPTARQALSCPWVQGNVASDTPLIATQARIREFNAKRKFKVCLQKMSIGIH